MKSNVSDYLELAQCVYRDACAMFITDVSDLRDIDTMISRTEREGLSFLTITLPLFARLFEKSIAQGYVDPTFFRSFRRNGLIPAFLQGITGQMFSHETGRIYDEDTIDTNVYSKVVDSVRQICLTFKKLEIGCSPERDASAFANFTAIEQSFDMFSLPEEAVQQFIAVSSVLWDNLVSTICTSQFKPKHGPGATADRVSGNQKYVWRRWHDRLEPYFPLIGYGYPLGISTQLEELEQVAIVAEDMEQPVKVISVPKTLKSPRIIAIEPCCMQYAQQGIMNILIDVLESNWPSAGHVNFRDQSINQQLAIDGSTTGQLATIDLSDASDRVPHALAMVMFRSNPDLLDSINACRSTRAKLPSGEIISPLRKFASMGSALCFPVEAMYFYTICVMALLEDSDLPVNYSNVRHVAESVHVYGDDIIVPVTNVIAVLDLLQKYNCKVNSNKTFFSGNFRESCGVDAYMGELVTPTYLSTPPPKNRQQGRELISWVATANLFYKRGYWKTAELMFKRTERYLGPLPFVSELSPVLGRFTFLGLRTIGRWNPKYHRFEVKGWIPKPVYRTDILGGWAAMMKSFVMAGIENSDQDEPFMDVASNLGLVDPGRSDKQHLARTALHHAVELKRGWGPSQR